MPSFSPWRIQSLKSPNEDASGRWCKSRGNRTFRLSESGVNNVLAFPGLFRGALDVRASKITEEMKLAAAEGIASLISDEELSEEYVIPNAFDPRVAEVVAKAVAEKAKEQGSSKNMNRTGG